MTVFKSEGSGVRVEGSSGHGRTRNQCFVKSSLTGTGGQINHFAINPWTFYCRPIAASLTVFWANVQVLDLSKFFLEYFLYKYTRALSKCQGILCINVTILNKCMSFSFIL